MQEVSEEALKMYQEAAAIILIAFIAVLVYTYKHLKIESKDPLFNEIFNGIRLVFLGTALVLVPAVLAFGLAMLEGGGAPQGLITVYTRAYKIGSIMSYLFFVVLFINVILSIYGYFVNKKNMESIQRFGRI